MHLYMSTSICRSFFLGCDWGVSIMNGNKLMLVWLPAQDATCLPFGKAGPDLGNRWGWYFEDEAGTMTAAAS